MPLPLKYIHKVNIENKIPYLSTLNAAMNILIVKLF